METKKRIIKATFDAISKSGVDTLTTKKISKSMNMSAGMIHHHFDTKDNLIYYTYEYFIELLRQEVLIILKSDKSPFEKLQELTKAQLKPSMMNSLSKNMWVRFWNDSIEKPKVENLLNIYSRRFITNLYSCFYPLLNDRKTAQIHAQTYFALIKGLWLETVVSKTLTPKDKPLEILFLYLDNLLEKKV